MEVNLVTRVNIAASQANVFKYLTELRYHYLWNPQIQRMSTREPLKLGSVYETMSVILGVQLKSKNVVTKFTPPEELELQNKIGLVKYQANFRLTQKLNRTVLTRATTFSTDSKAFVFTKPILKKLARRELQTDMQALKIAVENRLQ